MVKTGLEEKEQLKSISQETKMYRVVSYEEFEEFKKRFFDFVDYVENNMCPKDSVELLSEKQIVEMKLFSRPTLVRYRKKGTIVPVSTRPYLYKKHDVINLYNALK